MRNSKNMLQLEMFKVVVLTISIDMTIPLDLTFIATEGLWIKNILAIKRNDLLPLITDPIV